MNGRSMTIRAAAVLAITLIAAGCAVGAEGDATEVVQLTAQDAQVNDTLYQCLLDGGFPVTRGESGEVMFSDPDDERFAEFEATRADCTSQMTADGLLVAQSDDDLRAEYAAASELHRCLLTAGFPLVDLPSEQVYVEQHDSMNILEATAPVDLDGARAACPDEFRTLDQR